MKITHAIALSIILFFAGCIVALLIFKSENKTVTPQTFDRHIVRDTLLKLIPQEPIKLYKVKTKIIKLRDTIIQSYPFAAKLDTIIKHDTLKAEFNFPQNTISLELLRKPDSLRTERTTLFKTIEKEKPWWETPAYIIGGIITGIIIGKNIK